MLKALLDEAKIHTYIRIRKTFHEKGTPDAKKAEKENNALQLLVHGLPSEFLESTPGGPQEKALNTLLTTLGIILEQEHIVGAHPINPSSSSDKSPVTRLTVNSRETKDKIRKAAEATRRWGSAGGHTVFLRDTVKRKRTSSNEDPRTPKKTKLEETPKSRPKRGDVPPRRRLDDGRTETRAEERTRTGKAKLDEEVARREELKKVEELQRRTILLPKQQKTSMKKNCIIFRIPTTSCQETLHRVPNFNLV